MYIVKSSYFHQFAEGVTGGEYITTGYMSKEGPFKTKGAAHAWALEHGLKSFSRKGRGSEGYGDVGAESRRVTYIRLRDAIYPESDRNAIREIIVK